MGASAGLIYNHKSKPISSCSPPLNSRKANTVATVATTPQKIGLGLEMGCLFSKREDEKVRGGNQVSRSSQIRLTYHQEKENQQVTGGANPQSVPAQPQKQAKY